MSLKQCKIICLVHIVLFDQDIKKITRRCLVHIVPRSVYIHKTRRFNVNIFSLIWLSAFFCTRTCMTFIFFFNLINSERHGMHFPVENCWCYTTKTFKFVWINFRGFSIFQFRNCLCYI